MKPISGLYDSRDDANVAYQALLAAGFDQNRLRLVARDEKVDPNLPEKATSASHVAASAIKWALVGAVAGLILIFLASLSGMAPGLGGVASGTLVPILPLGAGGIAVGAAVGAILGAAIALNSPEEPVRDRADGMLHLGGTWLIVEAPDERYDEAARILEENGATQLGALREPLIEARQGGPRNSSPPG